jgi:hypothetical protein
VPKQQIKPKSLYYICIDTWFIKWLFVSALISRIWIYFYLFFWQKITLDVVSCLSFWSDETQIYSYANQHVPKQQIKPKNLYHICIDMWFTEWLFVTALISRIYVYYLRSFIKAYAHFKIFFLFFFPFWNAIFTFSIDSFLCLCFYNFKFNFVWLHKGRV